LFGLLEEAMVQQMAAVTMVVLVVAQPAEVVSQSAAETVLMQTVVQSAEMAAEST